MLNKRNFLRGSAAALAGTATGGALAVAVPRLDARAGLAAWQAHVGRAFEVDGHRLTLQAIQPVTGSPAGEQFSLRFVGELPAGLGDGLHELTPVGGRPLPLYMARTPLGMRADFCQLRG